MPCHSGRDPDVDAALSFGNQAALSGRTDDHLERRTRSDHVLEPGIQEVNILLVAKNQTIVRIEQRETLRDALDRID